MNKKIQHLLILIFINPIGLLGQITFSDFQLVEAVGFRDVDNTTLTNYRFIQNKALYDEKWDTLAQPTFWRTLMKMDEDSALLNIGANRKIITKVAVKDWSALQEERKNAIRDSIRVYYGLSSDARIFLTSGKKSFYDFHRVLPVIEKGIDIFKKNGVDPFYAQTILLIESPNKLQKSPVGAYGSFQLMKNVAIQMGLKVTSSMDERKDFNKSAWAASQLIKTICIPETNKILAERNIPINENELWYKLLVLHVYHAGAGNVKKAIEVINPANGNMQLITSLWQTEAGQFRNASQNYSQLALASLLELDALIYNNCDFIYPCVVEYNSEPSEMN
ncbi:MAG: transglycosylase SLT domain-containing protein [Vicingaceae bacterium]|nr:transglycosylase SLT domain-containing protein [Vicingaceae bacterium]